MTDLIDTLWNVKLVPYAVYYEDDTDLIDTLWNVKEYIALQERIEEKDLIDTLWNVKGTRGSSLSIRRFRFNRYIVECKGPYIRAVLL